MTHVSEFPASWWTERRRRDYYVCPDTGEVKLRPESETGKKVAEALRKEVYRLAGENLH